MTKAAIRQRANHGKMTLRLWSQACQLVLTASPRPAETEVPINGRSLLLTDGHQRESIGRVKKPSVDNDRGHPASNRAVMRSMRTDLTCWCR